MKPNLGRLWKLAILGASVLPLVLLLVLLADLWLFSPQQPKPRYILGEDIPVHSYSVVFSPDSKILASGGGDSYVWLWDVISGKNTAKLQGHDGHVIWVAFSPDGEMLASGGRDATIRLWDLATAKEKIKIVRGREDYDYSASIAFSPDGKTLAYASDHRTVNLWDVATGKEKDTLTGYPTRVDKVAFSPDGKTLASLFRTVLCNCGT